jgi:hypothetical protein
MKFGGRILALPNKLVESTRVLSVRGVLRSKKPLDSEQLIRKPAENSSRRKLLIVFVEPALGLEPRTC